MKSFKQYIIEEEEEKKLDPVGEEDGDLNNDGKEDKSDEYLSNRREARKKAIEERQ